MTPKPFPAGLALASALLTLGTGAVQAQSNSGVAVVQTRQIASGTTVKVKLLQTINSGTSFLGQKVRVQVAGDDTSGIPSGTTLIGRLTEVRAATNKNPGIVNMRFGIPNQNQEDSDTQTAMAFPDAASGHFVGKTASSEKSQYTSIGAGAGALLGFIRKRKLGDAIGGAALGGLGGYAADQAQKHSAGDINLASGTEMTIHLNTPLTLRTEIVAPY